ncbi:MAG: transposase [Paludibacteraceae bacterium]|nr:transposase [Paludibacteraceae bacterium]
MKKGLEIRLYPSKEQRVLIDRTLGCSRFVYNHILALKKELWEDYKSSFNPNLKSFKEEWKFLTKVPSQALANSYMDCLQAYNNFFNSIKKKTKQDIKYPKFHKKGQKDSFRIACTYSKKGIGDIRIEDKEHIKVPKLGNVKFKNYKDVDWSQVHIYNITIKKTPTDKYFASICCELSEKEYIEPKFYSCGFDLGLKDFCIFDSGQVIENPKYFRTSQIKLAKEQRKLNHCTKGSSNYKKQKLKVALIHEKIKNQRKDFQHKWSRQIVNENQVIISEDLNVRGMLKNHKLAKSIADASFSSFCDMIEYKSKEMNRTYIKISTFYPSSKLCHCCGYKNTTLKLADREWTCPNCHTYLDRDNNAALNILQEGLKILKCRNTVGISTGSDKSLKPVDTGYKSNLEQEPVIASGFTTCHAGKSTVFSS